jgi:hypothetical protein
MSNYAAAYSPIGSEYTIHTRRDTHLIVECPADKKLLMKRFMGSTIAMLIIYSVYIIIIFGMLGPLMMSLTPMLIIMPIILMAVIGVFPAAMYATVSKLAKPFTIELDKVANKLQLCTPNPYAAQGYYRRSTYGSSGQYFTSAWDLDKVVIRECLAGEYAGPGAFSLKMAFKNKFIVVATTATRSSFPVVFFASDRAELAQSLMGEIDRFLRGAAAAGEGWQGGEGERSYPGRGY